MNSSTYFKSTLFLIVILLSIETAHASFSSYKITGKDGNVETISSQIMSGNSYVSYEKLAKLILENAKTNNTSYKIYNQDESIEFVPGSFFFKYSNEENKKMAQMTLPAVSMKKNLMVPIEEFFAALSGIEVVDLYISGNTISLIGENKVAEKINLPKLQMKNISTFAELLSSNETDNDNENAGEDEEEIVEESQEYSPVSEGFSKMSANLYDNMKFSKDINQVASKSTPKRNYPFANMKSRLYLTRDKDYLNLDSKVKENKSEKGETPKKIVKTSKIPVESEEGYSIPHDLKRKE